jgi:hypothetical protein
MIMNVSPEEAGEALAVIQAMVKKTQRLIASSGAYKFLILWGIIWLLGFVNSQFLPADVSSYVWIGLDILGGLASLLVGLGLKRGIRSASPSTTGKRIAFFWLLLFVYCFIAISISWPVDAKQLSMMIIIFATLGWIAMGLLLNLASAWWGLALLALSLVSYFVLPGLFYLLMAILGGGGMIALGIYVRNRW